MKVIILFIVLTSALFRTSSTNNSSADSPSNIQSDVSNSLTEFLTDLFKIDLGFISGILQIFNSEDTSQIATNFTENNSTPTKIVSSKYTTTVNTLNSQQHYVNIFPPTTSEYFTSAVGNSAPTYSTAGSLIGNSEGSPISSTTGSPISSTTGSPMGRLTENLTLICSPNYGYVYCLDIVKEWHGSCPGECSGWYSLIPSSTSLGCNPDTSNMDWIIHWENYCGIWISNVYENSVCYGNWVTSYPYSSNTSQYVRCVNNLYLIEQCPNNGIFNSSQFTCDDICIEGVTKAMPDPKPFPYNKYMLCNNTSWQIQTCPLGTYYSFDDINTCTYYYCYPGETQAAPLDDTKYLVCNGSQWIENQCPPGERYIAYYGNCKSTLCTEGQTVPGYVYGNSLYMNCGTVLSCPNQDIFWGNLKRCYGSNETVIEPSHPNCSITGLYNIDYENIYFKCIGGKWVPKTCPEYGFYTSEEYGSVCSSNSACTIGSTMELISPPVNTEIVSLNVTNNDTLYWYCQGWYSNGWQIYACPPDQIYNSNVSSCVNQTLLSGCISGTTEGFGAGGFNVNGYYSCVNETWIIETCPIGAVILDGGTVCIFLECSGNWIENVYEVPTKYLLCLNNQYTVGQCPDKTIFNSSELTCGDTCIEGLSKEMPDPKPSPNKQYLLCNRGIWQIKTCPPGTYYNYDFNNTCAQYPCYPGERQAVPLDNTKYLECNGTVWIQQQCPPGERYNRYYAECESIACPAGKSVNSNVFGDSIYLDCNTVKACPNQDKFWYDLNRCYGSNETILVPTHPNCSITYPFDINYSNLYFTCRAGNWILETCPETEIFMSTEFGEMCAPYSQDCLYGATSELSVVPANVTVISLNVTDNGTFFWYCENNMWTIHTCPSAQVYSSKVTSCLPPSPTPGCASGSTQGFDNIGFLTSGYYLCVNGSWVIEKCPVGTWILDGGVVCIPFAATLETLTQWCYQEMMVSDPYDNTKYYICVNNIFTLQQCPNQEIFNSSKSTCGGACIEGQIKGISLTSSTVSYFINEYLLCNKSTWQQMECPEGTIFNSYDNTCTSVSCSPGLLADLNNQTKYYICLNNTYVEQLCPNQKIFNYSQQTCGDKCIEGVTQGIPGFEGFMNNQYLLCSNGTWKNETCPYGTIYNFYVLNECSYYYCYPGETQASPTDDIRYWECIGSQWVLQQCSPGERFSSYYGYCENTTCQENQTISSYTFLDSLYLDCGVLKVCPNLGKFLSTVNSCHGSNDTVLVPSGSNCIITTADNYYLQQTAYFECIEDKWTLGICPNNQIYIQMQYGAFCSSVPPECTIESTLEFKTVPVNVTLISLNIVNNGTFFWYCTNNGWTISTCPAGQLYYSNVSSCVTDLTSSSCVSGSLKGFNHPELLVTGFYSCIEGHWVIQKCPPGTWIFDGGVNCTPLLTTTSTTATPPTFCYNHTVETYLYDFTYYWECIDSNFILKQCPNYTQFDVTELTCGGICLEGLTKDMPSSNPYPNNKYLLCQSGNWILKTCPTGSYYFYNVTDYCLVSKCYEGEKQQAPLDDTKYLECSNENWVEHSCPAGDRFNRYYSECQSSKCVDGMKNDTSKFWDSLYLNCGVLTSCPNQDQFSASTGSCSGSNESPIVTNASCGGITVPNYSEYSDSYMECKYGQWVLEHCPNNQIFFETVLGSYCIGNVTCINGANASLITASDLTEGVTNNGSYYFHCYDYWSLEVCPSGEVFDSGLMCCTSTPNYYENGRICSPGIMTEYSNILYRCMNGTQWVPTTGYGLY